MALAPIITAKNLSLLALVLAAVLAAIRICAPGLIESAYLGKSIGIVNGLITQQQTYPLAHYLTKFQFWFSAVFYFSILGLCALFACYHLEKANREDHSLSLKARYGFLLVTSILLLLACYLFTLQPGGTYVNIMTHDMFIFWDGAYRVSQGQVPYLDFHTPIGILAYYLPYWGLKFSGQFPGALESANFIVAAWVFSLAIPILASRYRASLSVVALIFLGLIVIVPMNLGVTEIAHAMFYNRYGWVGLTLLYLFYMEPHVKDRRQFVLDVAAMTSLITFLFYLKMTYFVFGLTFMALLALVSSRKQKLVFYSMVIFCVVAVVVELRFLGLHQHYIKEVILAVKSSGVVRENRNTVGNVINELIFAGIGIFFIFKTRPLRFYDYCFIVLVLVSSLIIINQNFQSTGLVAVIALMLWGHEVAARTHLQTGFRSASGRQGMLISTVIFAMTLLFVGPPVLERVSGLALFYRVTSFKEANVSTRIMPNLLIGDRASSLKDVAEATDPATLFNAIRLIKRAQYLTQGEYIETIEQGFDVMRGYDTSGESIVVLDMANPFSLLLHARPPRGDYSFFHWKRNINSATYVPRENLFASVTYLMIPKFPMTPNTTAFLKETYGPYIRANFDRLVETTAWLVYKKR